jgi:hypothetical protein
VERGFSRIVVRRRREAAYDIVTRLDAIEVRIEGVEPFGADVRPSPVFGLPCAQVGDPQTFGAVQVERSGEGRSLCRSC